MDKVKVLLFSANPSGTTKLQLDEEIRQIRAKIRASEYRDALDLVPRFASRPDDFLQAMLEHEPHIVHFSGHGSSSAEELIVLDEQGMPKPISKEALVGLFRTLKDKVQVVLLNACYTRPQAQAISATIDCTIGMNKPIGDEAAIVFSASFYRALGFGRSVQDAFELGKVALLLEGISEEDTPELWNREGSDASKIFLVSPPEKEDRSQTQTSTVDSMPTLIVSNFVPSDGLSREKLHYRDASLSRTDQLRYRSHIDAGRLVIEPDDPYLDTVRSGGEIRALDFCYSPWARTFTFPALDIKIVNNTDKVILFHEAILRVRKSKLDPMPIPIIDGAGYYMTLPLVNIGWGPMKDCVLRFDLLRDCEQDAHKSESLEGKFIYPFELNLGDVEVAPDEQSLDTYFESAGVDVKTLRKLWQHRFGNDDGVYFGEESELGEPFDDSVLDLWSDLRPYVNQGRPLARRMSWSEYRSLEKRALGTFPGRKALIVGELEYGQTNFEGSRTRQTNRLKAVVVLGEPPCGAPLPPSYSYQVRLEIQGEDYMRTVPISHSLGAGATDRFVIFVSAEKSSIHEFDIVLRYNESEQLESRPVRLDLFLSRLDADYVKEDGSDQGSRRCREHAGSVAPVLRRTTILRTAVKSVIALIRRWF